jgi:phosphoribosylformylglycinamidine cyclo-ligase
VTDYKSAGVDVEAGQAAVGGIRTVVEETHGREVLTPLGGFAGLYALEGYRELVLVSGADGVGTKVELARIAGRLETIGIDCVAMCVNDVLCHGARPLFFLDYLAVDRLVPDHVVQIVSGVAQGCRIAGCALIGGETAEMPGVYAPGRFDVAGFCVGAVERNRLVDPARVQPGMIVLGLASAGVHSNGFSLIRAIFPELTGSNAASRDDTTDRDTWYDQFLKPTRIYVPAVQAILERVSVYGMAHITGGGWMENLPRMVAPGCAVEMDTGALPVPPVFGAIQERGVERREMYRTFNMGLGFALVVMPDDVDAAIVAAERAGETAAVVGRVVTGNGEVILS